MMTADRLDTIDVQLQGLLAVAQRQAQSIAELKDVSQQQAQTAERQGNQFDDRLDRIAAATERQGEWFEQFDDRLDKIAVTVERQAETAERQSKTIETLVSAMAELSRTNAAMNLDRHALLESAQRSAQASEAAQALAQSNQVAIRDLIEELRLGRTGQ
jgi:archaellum component FlaC